MPRSSQGLLFGTAGVPNSARARSTQAGIERLHEVGLGCMEVQFVQRVGMMPQTAAQVREVAARAGVRLTSHAPYYVNLNAREPEKREASRQRILRAARITHLFGGEGVTLHPAFYLDDRPQVVYERVKDSLEEMVAELRAEGNGVLLRPEVMGKGSQFGSLDELLRLSTEVGGVAPTIDFAHWHARTGAYNSYQEFVAVLEQVRGGLGEEGLHDILAHISGIEYGAKGERKHLVLPESDFQYLELLQALKDCGAQGLVVCESPNLEEDALILQEAYLAL